MEKMNTIYRFLLLCNIVVITVLGIQEKIYHLIKGLATQESLTVESLGFLSIYQNMRLETKLPLDVNMKVNGVCVIDTVNTVYVQNKSEWAKN